MKFLIIYEFENGERIKLLVNNAIERHKNIWNTLYDYPTIKNIWWHRVYKSGKHGPIIKAL